MIKTKWTAIKIQLKKVQTIKFKEIVTQLNLVIKIILMVVVTIYMESVIKLLEDQMELKVMIILSNKVTKIY